MASTRIPRPPRALLRLYLIVAPVVAVMLLVLAAAGFSRGYDLTAARCLALAAGTLAGLPYWLGRARGRR